MSGVCVAKGFTAAGVKAGIKKSGKHDVALIFSDRPAAVAGTFTTNLAAAAPVIVSRQRADADFARGVIINSGCANACTGEAGYADAVAMADEAARLLGVASGEILVCSTGLIGSSLPMDKIMLGIQEAVGALAPRDDGAILAIMTTDSQPKRIANTHSDGWSIGGIAKGAGMIAPNMATMLAFITTDAIVDPALLKSLLRQSVLESFNRITIDADTSTNDSVIALANGASGKTPTTEDMKEALDAVCRSLAEQIVADGEGATKFARIRVRGAISSDEALRAARTVAESSLVKTALYGQDANWGRIAAALGRAGVEIDFTRLSISIADRVVLKEGQPASKETIALARAGMAEREIIIVCDLALGRFATEVLTTDLSPEYVVLNAEYEL
ncbi:MAG: bifunctional glutamate N-acetyltransferase/amino-acid acetyltransferase ArgJ [Actinomycetota bacterium]